MTWMIPLLISSFVTTRCVKVDSERIVVGDLAPSIVELSALDRSTVVGFAPRFGASRIFSPHDILLLGRKLGVPVDITRLPPICVERMGTIISEAQIRDAIAATLAGSPVTIEVVDFSRMAVPPGRVEFPRSGAPASARDDQTDPVLWRGKVVDHLGMTFPIWARVRLLIEDSIVIAAEDLKPGEPITREQVLLVSIKRPAFADQRPLTIDQVAGKLPSREVRKGMQVTANVLRDPLAVVSGDMVRVTTSVGEAQVRFDGKAQTSGRKGDTVLVQNPASGHSLRARVIEKGVVTVDAQINQNTVHFDNRR